MSRRWRRIVVVLWLLLLFALLWPFPFLAQGGAATTSAAAVWQTKN